MLALASILVMFLPDNLQSLLVLSRDGIANKHIWQLLTAHFVHSNVWHLVFNITGLYLTWFLFSEEFEPSALIATLMVCTVGLSITLVLITDINNYVGLSGTLHGLFAYALVRELKHPRPTTFVLIAAAIGKLAYEQLGGSTDATEALIGVSVAIDAHLWGAILGIICGCISLLFPTTSNEV
jgi:rhomboid family GlyGly-CTERM serine protease